jgi:hypothetical protein
MNTTRWLLVRLLLPLAFLLGGCQGADRGQVVYTGAPPVEPAPEPEPPPPPDPRPRIIADMLYEALLSFDANRLTTPPGNNAYDRFVQVLDLDPGNTVALEGITNIALRYVGLADAAMNQAQYDNAASLLNRGERVKPGLQQLAEARDRLAVARKNKLESFPLDPRALSSQSQEMLDRLAEIAEYIRNSEATFLINARNDEEGRWIYKIMREAVEGYRLRGDIVIASAPAVMVGPPPG